MSNDKNITIVAPPEDFAGTRLADYAEEQMS